MKQKTIILFFCIFALFVSRVVTATEDIALRLQQSIVVLDQIIKQARSTVTAETLPLQQKQEYTVFINYLENRVANDCKDLATLIGAEGVKNLPCLELRESLVDANPPPALTSSEKVSALEQSLSQALGEFDEMLLKEDEKIASRIPSQRESGGGGLPGTSGSGPRRRSSRLRDRGRRWSRCGPGDRPRRGDFHSIS